MGRKTWFPILALCLLLAGCAREEAPVPPDGPPAPPPVEAEQPAPQPPRRQDISLERLTVEVVVSWEDAEDTLSNLEALSRLLGEALAEQDCLVEEPVAVTISTAGGITGNALAEGGVDAAFLPSEDFAAVEGSARAVLATDDEACTGTAAVTLARDELSGDFPSRFADALLSTEAGAQFLALCYPNTAFLPAGEETLETIRTLYGPEQ